MKQEHFYIAENLLEFKDERFSEEIIETQITNQETLIEIGSGTELVFKNEKLIEIYEYFEVKREVFRRKKEIKEDEFSFRKPIYPPKSILAFKESINGYHQIGGDFSEEFKEPTGQLAVPFQYLGYINNADPNFSWLPYKLHLTYPIFLEPEIVFLDYSDNKNPKIFNKEELEKYPSIFSEVNEKSKITFIPQKFDLQRSCNYTLKVNSGIPNWIQGHYIPECPKSGKKMKFVCQIYNGSKTAKSNIIPENDWNKNYFEKMEFLSADLYVFIEPESNIVCMFTQGT